MELVFKNSGPTTGFSNWLKSFQDIQSSILIECDLTEEFFVSKGFDGNHTIIKYGKVSFDNAGFELLYIKDNEGNTYTREEWVSKYTERIKIGIFLILNKFIKVVETFSETDYKLSIQFDVFNNGNTDEFHAQFINFKSKSLKMKVKDCNISEFEQLSDELFFTRINVLNDAMSFEVSVDAIKNLSAISSVFTNDPKRDIIKFYTKIDEDTNKYALYAYDQSNESYDYLLGYLKDGTGVDAVISIYRLNFFSAINTKQNGNIVISISASTNNKFRIETVDGTSYTILAAVSQA